VETIAEERNPHAREINRKRKALSMLAWLQVVVDVIVGGWELQHGWLCGCIICLREDTLKTPAPLLSREVMSPVLITSVTVVDWRLGIAATIMENQRRSYANDESTRGIAAFASEEEGVRMEDVGRREY